MAAAEALYHIAPRSDDVVAALISAMRDTSGEVQDAVVVALSTVGTRAIPGLIEALNDDHVSVRLIALAVLAERTGDASSTTRAIGRALSDSSDEVRIAAAHTLQRIGPAARDAEPQLLEAARNAAVQVRDAALRALVANGAGPERLRPVLEAALRDSAAALRTTAVSLAVEAGMTAEKAFPAILPLTADSSSIVRQAAFRALETLLGAPTVGLQVRRVLERAATHPDSVVRRIVHRALSPTARATTNHE